jgi:hypothetical protein
MPNLYGEWLRKQRQARGWNVPEMCRQLRQAARPAGDKLPSNQCLNTMVRRWENDVGGVSERYRLHYCRAFNLAPDEFGIAPIATGAFSSAVIARSESASSVSFHVPGGQDRQASANRPHSRVRPTIEGEVLMTAHEGSEHAERAERRDLGDATLEQFRTDVIRLSREYMTGEPLPLFVEMRRVRGRIYTALDRQIWPRDRVELYFLLGCLSGLMADAADDLGSAAAGEELARAGWAYAASIDHKPLMAWLRMELGHIAKWASRPRQSLEFATGGLEFVTAGPNGAQLQLLRAVAAARLGDTDTVGEAIAAAGQARDRDYADDVLALGGEFGFSRATQHYSAGSALVQVPGSEVAAIAELELALDLYAAGPDPGEDHSMYAEMRARVELAGAQVRIGDLEAATAAVGPVLALPPGRRIASLSQRLIQVRADLAAPPYHGSVKARDLDEQIELFTATRTGLGLLSV